jgi:TonB-linked SusC/RagA family outer membrane protein
MKDLCLYGLNKPYRSFKKLFFIMRIASMILIFNFQNVLAVSTYSPIADELQQLTVSGKVTDASTGEALPGVNIVVKGTTSGTISGTDGKYLLPVTDRKVILVASFIGYVTKEIPLDGKENLDIILAGETTALEEVVVIGYGTQRKTTLTGSVGSLKGDKIAMAPVANISNSIAGKMAGVSMTQSSGQPGKNNPTLYIRGVGTTGSQSALIVVDGIPGRSMNQIDPESIESISVLKDAAAIAPFGLGGANGVILITTKSGEKRSPMTINLNSQFGWQNPTIYPKVLGPEDFMLLSNEAYLNDNPGGTNLPYAPAVIADYDNLHAQDPDLYPIADYDQLFQKNIPIQQHHLEFSGGSDKISFNAGFRYYKENGMFDPDKITGQEMGYDRINYYVNMKFDITKTTKISLQSSSALENTDDIDVGVSSQSVFEMRKAFPAVYPIFFSNGTWASYNQGSAPAYLNSGGYSNGHTDTRYSTISIEQQLPFIQGLSIKGSISYDNSVYSYKGLHKPFYYYVIDYNTTPYSFSKQVLTYQTTTYPYLTERRDIYNTITAQGFVNYERTFGQNKIIGLFVFEGKESNYTTVSATRQKFPVDIDELSMGSSNRADYDNSGTSSEASQLSYVYRLGYSYRDKYLLEAAGRYDGHYYFAPDRKWGFFPSFSIGWRISEEDFMKGLASINNLKIRGSWGKSGNLAGAPFQYLSGYSIGSNYALGTGQMVNGAYTNLEANPLITWEEAAKTDIGIEASLWNSLLTFEADFFYEKRNGMLLPPEVTVPVEYGISLAQENAGVMVNQGFEVSVGSEHQWQNGLRIGLSGNFSFAKNKMIEIFESSATYDNPNRRRTGRAYGTAFGYHVLGMFSTSDDTNGDGIINSVDGYNIAQVYGTIHPGDVKYADVSGPDGTPDGKVDMNDEVVIGYPRYPAMTYGFTLTSGWKGFDLDLFFQGSAMQSISTLRNDLDPFDNNASNCLYEYYDNRWSPDNQATAKYPRAQFGRQWTNASDMFNPDITFLRLKTGTLGYTLPANITKSVYIKKLRLYFLCQNLFTLCNLDWLDPEGGSGGQNAYPLMKTYSFGVNVTF